MRLRYCWILVFLVIYGCVDRGSFGPFSRSLNVKDYGYEVVEDPTGEAPTQYVERFEVRPGDCHYNNGWSDCRSDRERSELSERNKKTRNGEYWYGWSLYIPEDFAVIFPTKTAIGQFHQHKSHPIWMFQNSSGGYWLDKQVIGVTEKYFQLIPREKMKGIWHRIEVNANWQSDDTGFLKIWVNGELKVNFKGQTAKDNPIYFKYGIYRSFMSRYKNAYGKDEVPAQVLYFANVKRASTREGLAPN